jgi:hypothetical protein
MKNNGGVAWSPILGQGNFHRAARFGRITWAVPGQPLPGAALSGAMAGDGGPAMAATVGATVGDGGLLQALHLKSQVHPLPHAATVPPPAQPPSP